MGINTQITGRYSKSRCMQIIIAYTKSHQFSGQSGCKDSIRGPTWVDWNSELTLLPKSAFGLSKNSDSTLAWLATNPHKQNISYTTLEHVFLAIGLILHEISLSEDVELFPFWMSIARSIADDVDTDPHYSLRSYGMPLFHLFACELNLPGLKRLVMYPRTVPLSPTDLRMFICVVLKFVHVYRRVQHEAQN
jgi:hypothetical protein